MREKKEKLLKTSGADVLSSRKELSLRPDEEIGLIYAHQDKTENKYDGVLK